MVTVVICRKATDTRVNIFCQILAYIIPHVQNLNDVCMVCMMVHRCLYGDALSYLLDLIKSSADATVRAGLRSAASSTVAVPRTMSSLGDRSFAAAGPRAWNRLPPPLRRVHSVAAFKRQLKTFLFDCALN